MTDKQIICKCNDKECGQCSFEEQLKAKEQECESLRNLLVEQNDVMRTNELMIKEFGIEILKDITTGDITLRSIKLIELKQQLDQLKEELQEIREEFGIETLYWKDPNERPHRTHRSLKFLKLKQALTEIKEMCKQKLPAGLSASSCYESFEAFTGYILQKCEVLDV